jgi:multiple sugar transport system permease protein
MHRMAEVTVHQPRRIMTQSARKRQDTLAGYLFMTPVLIIFLVFLIIPIGAAVYISFTDWNGITPVFEDDAYKFVGLDNYRDLLQGQHQEDGQIVSAG